jgi:hypothetical protein
VDQAERVLIESIMDSGWTWERLGNAAALQTARRATDLDRPATIGTRPARAPEEEARRRLSWTELRNDSLNELDDLINNRMSTSPRGPAAGARRARPDPARSRGNRARQSLG